MISYRKVPLAELEALMGPAFLGMPKRHWAEVTDAWRVAGLDMTGIELAVDYGRYKQLEQMGMLRCFGIFMDGRAAGYAFYLILDHLHYRAKCAMSDMFYIDPDARSIFSAMGLFKFIEDEMRDEGVQLMTTLSVSTIPGAGKILERLGHAAVEINFVKRLA